MGHGRPFGGIVGHGRRNEGGDGGTDIFTQHHGTGHVEADPPVGQEDHREGHGGAGGLQDHGQHGTYHGENEHAAEAEAGQVLHEGQGLGIAVQIRNGVFHGRQADEQEGETDDELAEALGAVVLRHGHCESQRNERDGKGGNVETESEEGNQPGRCRGADVGAHDHADGVAQGQQARIDHAHHHDGGSAG